MKCTVQSLQRFAWVIGSLLLLGGVGVIGVWIGFQEEIRQEITSLRKAAMEEQSQAEDVAATSKQADHTVIESDAEAKVVLEGIEGQLRTLAEDKLP